MVYFLLPYMPFEPVGGVKTLVDYALCINALCGKTRAVILSDSKYLKSWLPASHQKIHILPTSTKIKEEDTLVFPEVILEQATQYQHVKRKILAVLNWKYFEEAAQRTDLQKAGFHEILTNSRYAKKRISAKFPTLKVTHIPHVIDTTTYRAVTPMAKRPRHSFLILNRKNTHHIPAVLRFLESISHTATVVNNLHPDLMPHLYDQHQFFINLGYPEGFCRPAAEAMAAGCIPVGFTGGGANDFMFDGATALVAEDANESQLLQKINQAIHLSLQEKTRMAKAARKEICEKYKKQHQQFSIAKIFAHEIGHHVRSASPVKRACHSVKRIVSEKRTPVAILQYQLFMERARHEQIMRSKFYKLWQWYCAQKFTISSILGKMPRPQFFS